MKEFLKGVVENIRLKKEKGDVKHDVKKVLDARKRVLFALRGQRYTISATCDKCSYSYKEDEIIESFSEDKFSLVMLCVKCHSQKVIPYLSVDAVTMPLYSPFVTLIMLKLSGTSTVLAQDIKADHRNLYYSTIFHYGSLKHAFSLIKREYYATEINDDWREKITPLLDVLPLSVIAQAVGVPKKSLRKLKESI